MKTVVLWVWLITELAGSTFAAQGKINWKTDYEAAHAQARRDGKLLVAYFWLEGRPLHRAMEEETFSHPEVLKLLTEKFVSVELAISSRPEIYERTIGGRGGLGTCVLDGSGDVVSMLPRYADAPEFLSFLKKAQQGYPGLKAARVAAGKRPNDLGALQKLAEIYQALDSPRRAEECFAKLIQLGSIRERMSGDVKKYVACGHERLARFRALRGKNLEAKQHILEYRKLDHPNQYGWLDRILLTEALVAWIERRLGDSIQILEGALREYPESQERDQMLLALGVDRHEAGDDARAMRVLEKMIQEHPLSPRLALAKEQIAHIKNPPPDHAH